MTRKALSALDKLVPAPSTKNYQFYRSHYELIRDEIQRLQSELTAARDEAERLRGRVAQLHDAAHELYSWCVEHLTAEQIQAGLAHGHKIGQLLEFESPSVEAFVALKQAEAVESAVYELAPGRYGPPDDPSPEFNAVCEMCAGFSGYAQRLRNQAEADKMEAEAGGGDE